MFCFEFILCDFRIWELSLGGRFFSWYLTQNAPQMTQEWEFSLGARFFCVCVCVFCWILMIFDDFDDFQELYEHFDLKLI